MDNLNLEDLYSRLASSEETAINFFVDMGILNKPICPDCKKERSKNSNKTSKVGKNIIYTRLGILLWFMQKKRKPNQRNMVLKK